MKTDNTNQNRVHPLFDPDSLYRLGTTQSIWADRGQQSIRQFFEGLRRESLQQEWLNGTPEKQNWGYDDELNTAIHQHMLDLRDRAQQESEQNFNARQLESSLSRNDSQRLSLACFDLSDGCVEPLSPPPPNTGTVFFTGCGQSVEQLRRDQSTITSFDVDIPIPKDREGHECLLLIFTRSLLEQLKGLKESPSYQPSFGAALSPSQIESPGEALNFLETLFDPEVLEPSEPEKDIESYRHASRLATLLACAPGLARDATRGGPFQTKVKLEHDSPQLETDTTVVCCFGPPMQQTAS